MNKGNKLATKPISVVASLALVIGLMPLPAFAAVSDGTTGTGAPESSADVITALTSDYSVTVVGGTADKATAHAGERVTITANAPELGKAFVQWAHVDGVNYDNASSAATTFTMPEKDVVVTAVTAPIAIRAVGDKVYTGSPIEPTDEVAVSLTGVDIILTDGDYEVSFEDNVDAGDAKVIVTMASPRAGSAMTTFKITPADISTATVEVADQVYDGAALTPAPTVTWNGQVVAKDNYTLSYANNVHVGSASVTVTGKGNFQEDTTATGSFTITKAPLTIAAKDQTYIFNGKQQGEGDTAYEEPAQIAEKVTVEGLRGSDALTSVVLDGEQTDVGVYVGEIKVTGYTIDEAADDYDVTLVPGTLSIVQKSYKVTFVDYDGSTVLKEAAEYDYGTPAADIERPADPTREPDAEYTYKFTGWTPEIADVTADAVYTAVYESGKRKYEVTWLQDDGTLIDKTTVEYGEKPAHADPTKAATAKCTYSFAGWSPEVVAVTGNATYKATYTETAKKGTLAFDCGGGTIDGKTSLTIEADVGDVITIPEAPVRDGFTFKYWKGSEYHPGDKYTVEGDHTFIAVWEEESDSGGGSGGGDTGGASSPGSGAKGSSPKTGDGSGMLIYPLSVTALASLGLIVLSLRRRRARR